METQPLSPTAWSLDDLFASEAEAKAALAQAESLAAAFEADVRPQLCDALTPAGLNTIIERLEAVQRLAQRAGAYAELWFSQNTQNQAAQALLAQVEQTGAQLSNRLLFFSLWWKSLPDERAAALMQEAGELRYWLEEIRHFKPYTLSEPEEKIINIKDVSGVRALDTLYSLITNRYLFNLKVDGKTQRLTRGELMVHVRQPDPHVRRAAYRALYRTYGEDAPVLGQIYQSLVRDWRNENVNLRGFASPLAVRNLANDIPDAVVQTLLDVCQHNTGIFQRFFRLKARLLGMARLRRYDLYAPVAPADKRYTYAQAHSLVMQAFERFDPHMRSLAERVFDQRHVDSDVRRGKRGGAFCLTALPEVTPWVLLNFQGRADDAATMAHELGHAIHSMLAGGHRLFTSQACLPLAETASTFGEMLLVDHLLEHEQDPAVRRDLIFRQVDDAYATIQRQAFFALFEQQAHEMINQGATVDDLSKAYLKNLKQQFGDAVQVGREFRWEWVSIPHIYSTPFYVYAYAFGQLLVLALYAQYRREGEAFKPRYLRLLSAGGSLPPLQILDEAGLNARQASFWQGGFDVINGLVTRLEEENR